MEKTNSPGQPNRACIFYWLRWITLSAAILFLSSVRSFGLFSGEFLYPCNYRTQATASILAVDRDADIDLDAVKWLEINTSFDYLNMLRDSVYLNNFVPRVSFWIDAIMLPGFQMVDDTGTVSTIFPVSLLLGIKGHVFRYDSWYASVSAWGGVEFISDYNYMGNYFYGASCNAGWKPFDGLTVGTTIGLSGEHTNLSSLNFYFEPGVRYRYFALDILASFTLDGYYKTFKAGFEYHVSPGFSVLWGGNYTLEYNGWNLTGGVELSQFRIFETASRAGLSVMYNLVAGPSFTLTLAMEFDRFAKAKPETPVTNGQKQ